MAKRSLTLFLSVIVSLSIISIGYGIWSEEIKVLGKLKIIPDPLVIEAMESQLRGLETQLEDAMERQRLEEEQRRLEEYRILEEQMRLEEQMEMVIDGEASEQQKIEVGNPENTNVIIPHEMNREVIENQGGDDGEPLGESIADPDIK